MASLLSPAVIKNSGAGKAYQSVAQSSAIAISDGATYMRNIQTISTAAVGTAMAKFLATKNPIYLTLVPVAMGIVPTSAASFAQISAAAIATVKSFPT